MYINIVAHVYKEKNAGNGVQREFFELVCMTKREKERVGNMRIKSI